MREPPFDSTWTQEIQEIHREHQQFAEPRAQPNVFSWYRARTRRIVGLLNEFAPAARRVLDIGCAQGTIAITLAESGYEVTANDIRSSYISYARMRDDNKRVNFIRENFLDYNPVDKFQAVIFTEVIEHIVDHSTFLRHILNCMSPGGILIVTTPNHGYIRQRLPSFSEVNLEENKDKQFSSHGSDHFYLFKKQELMGLLNEAGFEVIKHEYFLPFLQYGIFKLAVLWRILPASFMEAASGLFDNRNICCAQQLVVARRPDRT
jgi:2-polyprenyl-6-hydroxyphenyl methylase/3-demethylubiquinone-9 3-methyltransferase